MVALGVAAAVVVVVSAVAAGGSMSLGILCTRLGSLGTNKLRIFLIKRERREERKKKKTEKKERKENFVRSFVFRTRQDARA